MCVICLIITLFMCVCVCVCAYVCVCVICLIITLFSCVCVHVCVIGASLSEPHTSDTTYFRSVRLCICIRTSLPPEAPDACAHARSVVLILAHLYDAVGPRRTEESLC